LRLCLSSFAYGYFRELNNTINKRQPKEEHSKERVPKARP
jgi:hypothetical protein